MKNLINNVNDDYYNRCENCTHNRSLECYWGDEYQGQISDDDSCDNFEEREAK